MSKAANLPDEAGPSAGSYCTVQHDSQGTPVVESQESYEASQDLLDAQFPVGTPKPKRKSVNFGGLEFPHSGGMEGGRRIV